jgi:hypothetical protein
VSSDLSVLGWSGQPQRQATYDIRVVGMSAAQVIINWIASLVIVDPRPQVDHRCIQSHLVERPSVGLKQFAWVANVMKTD